MLDRLLSIIAPHYCYGCGQSGQVLCDDCKKHIIKPGNLNCLICGGISVGENLCKNHSLLYKTASFAVYREDFLVDLIDDMKFHNKRANLDVIVDILDERLPDFTKDAIFIPIPTTPKNIRIRGYDHMATIVKKLAKIRGCKYENPLRRKNNQTQHFAKSADQRREQAKNFFEIKNKVNKNSEYVIIDDIFTTGSTLDEAAKYLRKAGADQVSIAVFARQTLK